MIMIIKVLKLYGISMKSVIVWLKRARRLDIIFVDKQAKETKIIDTGIPGDTLVKEKELDKIGK